VACGITLIKKFTYRGQPEEFSNQYWFTGGTPSGPSDWRALFDALVTQEKTCYSNATTVVRGYGYASDADDATSVWSVDLTLSPDTPVAGTLVTTGGTQLPGDTAVWVKWRLTRKSTKGRNVYLRKYFHDAYRSNSSGVPDNTMPQQVTNLTAFANKLKDGTFLDARTVTARGHVDTVVAVAAGPYVTVRTLRRRPKRTAP
jgi:hypothetical protein